MLYDAILIGRSGGDHTADAGGGRVGPRLANSSARNPPPNSRRNAKNSSVRGRGMVGTIGSPIGVSNSKPSADYSAAPIRITARTPAQSAAMPSVQAHLRNTFLAGAFAAVPIAGTAFVLWYVDAQTRFISKKFFNINVPFLGVAMALVAIYLLGLIVTSLLGKLLLRAADAILGRLPVLKPLYQAWKQVALTSGEGVFAKVVLISADDAHNASMLGFTSGQPTTPGGDTLCVFVPAAPNPTSGRLYFVQRDCCRILAMSTEEAFKMILSGGSYIPGGLS
jgi:uncharacterized membrane protein